MRLGSIEKVLGCITDREAAVQLAFNRLEDKYHWLVNLVCQVSRFCSCSIKRTAAIALLGVGSWLQPPHQGLLKEFTAVGTTLETTIKISNFETSHAWFRKLLHEYQKQLYGRSLEICSQV